MIQVESLPLRAALPPLVPMGLHTERVESLTSYVTRLASANCISVNKLICKLILPQIASGTVIAPSRNTSWGDLHLVNGMGQMASNWAVALNAITGRTDLVHLTFLPWACTLPTKISLIYRYRRWCPYCLDEMLESGTEVYDRLIWAVNLVRVCPWHLVTLETHCPKCGHRNCSELPGRRLAGFCSHCFNWLGKVRIESNLKHDDISDSYETWVARCFSKFLNRSPISSTEEVSKRIAKMISVGIRLRCDGVAAEFAKKVKRRKSTIVEWQQAKVLPSLQSLAEISYAFELPFDCLIFGEECAWKYSASERIVPTTRIKKRDRYNHNWDKNRRILEEIVSGAYEASMSVNAVAASLSVDRRFLRRRFPELVKEVSEVCRARRAAVREKRTHEKENTLFKAALEIARTLERAGKYPSRKRIILELTLQGFVANRTHSPILRSAQKRFAMEIADFQLKGT